MSNYKNFPLTFLLSSTAKTVTRGLELGFTRGVAFLALLSALDGDILCNMLTCYGKYNFFN